MAETVGAPEVWALSEAIGQAAPAVQRRSSATVTRVDHDGTVWVHLVGGVAETPVTGGAAASASAGDSVLVIVENGRVRLSGNSTQPAVGYRTVSEQVGPVAAAAETARLAADSAHADAVTAGEMAKNATLSATRASTAANDALTQLSLVEDVAGTLDWIASHGSFVATADTEVAEGKVYFELSGGDYVPIASPDPDADPSEEGWYELDLSDSQSAYIMAHLAVTSAGLWVLPSGLGQAAGPQAAPGYKLLLASDGARVYDGSGHLVTTYGESIAFDSSRPQSIGGEDAYILYYDSDSDGVPDTIRIGGSRVVVSAGGKTLSQVLADVEQATSDAATAVQVAEDVPIVTLSSTNGTVFRRNLGVSTTIVATIFTPGGRISTAAELAARFGAGAYLQWGWRDVVTDADHALLSSDPRISQGGFALTVTPEDIDTQAVITCSLNY